jgi:hypothetical protein
MSVEPSTAVYTEAPAATELPSHRFGHIGYRDYHPEHGAESNAGMDRHGIERSGKIKVGQRGPDH